MSNETWPATFKQKSYGRHLENHLTQPSSDWNQMSVADASRRIDELVILRTFREITNTLSEATEAS